MIISLGWLLPTIFKKMLYHTLSVFHDISSTPYFSQTSGKHTGSLRMHRDTFQRQRGLKKWKRKAHFLFFPLTTALNSLHLTPVFYLPTSGLALDSSAFKSSVGNQLTVPCPYESERTEHARLLESFRKFWSSILRSQCWATCQWSKCATAFIRKATCLLQIQRSPSADSWGPGLTLKGRRPPERRYRHNSFSIANKLILNP